MDHDDVRERLELAGAEPGGIDRLMAGDTPTAQAVGGHLAGCPSCTEELARLRRVSAVLRDAVAATPPPELRDRTLAYVHALGRERGTGAGVAATDLAPEPLRVPVAAPVATPSARVPRLVRRLAPIGVIAAAVALSVATTSLIVESRLRSELDVRAGEVATLQRVTTASLLLAGEPDATRVVLRAPGATDETAGTLLYSPSTTSLVVVATGLVEPAAGREYRCWFEVDGRRQRVGRMFFAGDIAFWLGPVPDVTSAVPGSQFGISLMDEAGVVDGADPVLLGEVAAR